MRPRSPRSRALLVAMLAAAAVGCERESRPFRDLPVAAARSQVETESPLRPGGSATVTGAISPYRENAWGIAEGKRLFTAYNCVGCHAHGGGAIGPALMDDQWRYGFMPANIYSSIVEGRANGMPAFRDRIPDHQVWQLVAYIQSMSGQTPIDASPGRADQMHTGPPETIRPYAGRVQTGHR